MKKLMILSLAVLISGGAMAAKKKEAVNKNKPVFTTVLENKISSIKDQSRSGTCWNYSTLYEVENHRQILSRCFSDVSFHLQCLRCLLPIKDLVSSP